MIGTSERSVRLLLLRNPYNLFASLLKSGRMTEASKEYYVDLWKHHAREFAGETSELGQDLVCINFDRWSESEAYRQKLGRQIGLVTDGTPHAKVAKTGGGSSFQGLVEDAGQLQVNTRWKEFQDNTRYQRLFDDEVLDYAGKILDIR